MIGIVTATYKKPTLELFCYSVNQLRNDLNQDIPCVCTGEAEDKPLCDKYNIHHIQHPNNFVSDKFNVSLKTIQKYNPDNVLILGSDDVISSDTLCWYIDHDDYDLVGTQNLYVYNSSTRELIKLWLQNIGAGRMYHRRVLDKYDWNIWPNGLKRNLDQNSYRLVEPDIKTSIKTNGFLLDIKTNNNITSWEKIAARPESIKQNISILDSHITQEQLQLLNQLS